MLVRLRDCFLAVFYSMLPHLQQQGEICRPVREDFLRILLNPFPSAVGYRYHEDWIVETLVIRSMQSALLRQRLRERRSSP